jgi:amidophosphoribosyltransferase
MLIDGVGIVAFRDPHGIRPLVLGVRGRGSEREYMIASESAAFSVGAFALLRDIQPGELVIINDDQKVTSHRLVSDKVHTPCIFEFVYFARPDSLIDDISVHRTRMRLGHKLGLAIKDRAKKMGVDCVVPVPESARTAAIEIALALHVPFREGFVKNRYIGRTFITPGQQQRVSKVRRKLTTLPLELKGKRVLIVDDSIVRGTTIQEIVRMVRSAGAKKVYVASTAPAVLYENVYGIDIATTDELVAIGKNGTRKTDAAIAHELGADAIFYQSIHDLYEAGTEGNPAITQFDGSCFDGVYVSGQEKWRKAKTSSRLMRCVVSILLSVCDDFLCA